MIRRAGFLNSGMKLSLRGEYALRALVVLGLRHNPQGTVVRIQSISEEQNIPGKFLAQILNDLRAAGFVESRRGKEGGYRLARSPEEISLAEVIRMIEGPLAPVSCVSEKYYQRCTCPDEARCAVRDVMFDVRASIVGVLEKVTVAELCRRARVLNDKHASATEYVI